MKIHELSADPGAKKDRKRVGRGSGSGLGKTSGKGHKGQKSRSGGGVRPGFEGGQMPLIRRIPKRGFYNPFRVEYLAVNVKQLDIFGDGEDVCPADLYDKNIINKRNVLIKILGDGDITKKLNVKANAFSKSAIEKIQKAGGTVEVI